MRDIVFTASGGYLLEPFKRGDSFPEELIRYSMRITKAISEEQWGHDMTLFFQDSNEPAYYSSSDSSLYWWQTPQSFEVNILEIVRKIALSFPEVEFCLRRIHTDTLRPDLYIKGTYMEEVADNILVVESNDPELITQMAHKFGVEQQGNRTLFYMERVVKSKLLESLEYFVGRIKKAFPDAEFSYLLWDKNARSFQIKRGLYYNSTKAYLDVISYDEREKLPDLEKTELMNKWH